MATASPEHLIDRIAHEIAIAVNTAVEGWMSEFESILYNPDLSSLERLRGVQEILARYRFSTSPGEQMTSAANG